MVYIQEMSQITRCNHVVDSKNPLTLSSNQTVHIQQAATMYMYMYVHI